MSDPRIYRCSDGHLYTALRRSSFLKSIHLGFRTHLQRCPVDGRWRRATLVRRDELSTEQLHEARSHSFS